MCEIIPRELNINLLYIKIHNAQPLISKIFLISKSWYNHNQITFRTNFAWPKAVLPKHDGLLTDPIQYTKGHEDLWPLTFNQQKQQRHEWEENRRYSTLWAAPRARCVKRVKSSANSHKYLNECAIDSRTKSRGGRFWTSPFLHGGTAEHGRTLSLMRTFLNK